MTNSERILYWDSKPEIALQNEFGVLDRRILIKHVAELFEEKPIMLEIGVNEGHVLSYCHESLRSYMGVDISFERLEPMRGAQCKAHHIEMSSLDFWKQAPRDLQYDIVFVDGNHGTHEAYVDATQAMLRLSHQGYVLVHDVNPPEDNPDNDESPIFAHNRIKNLPGWYARILEGHPEGLAIYFRTE